MKLFKRETIKKEYKNKLMWVPTECDTKFETEPFQMVDSLEPFNTLGRIEVKIVEILSFLL